MLVVEVRYADTFFREHSRAEVPFQQLSIGTQVGVIAFSLLFTLATVVFLALIGVCGRARPVRRLATKAPPSAPSGGSRSAVDYVTENLPSINAAGRRRLY